MLKRLKHKNVIELIDIIYNEEKEKLYPLLLNNVIPDHGGDGPSLVIFNKQAIYQSFFNCNKLFSKKIC